MTVLDYAFMFALLMTVFSWVLFVLFGQVTVRKLRKNENTKRELGFEFMSGWDIFNVAQILWMPEPLYKLLVRPRKNKETSFTLLASKKILINHTNRIDRALAVTFYWTYLFTALLLILLLIVYWLGDY